MRAVALMFWEAAYSAAMRARMAAEWCVILRVGVTGRDGWEVEPWLGQVAGW